MEFNFSTEGISLSSWRVPDVNNAGYCLNMCITNFDLRPRMHTFHITIETNGFMELQL